MAKKPKIYLDYAATTPVDPRVFRVMQPYFTKKFGNPSSIHFFGQEGQIVIDEAREKVAKFLNCSASEIIFTGSASESDNLAIKGLMGALREKKREGERIHIVTSLIEHKAVLETCENLEKQKIKATYLPVSSEGIISLSDLEQEITPETDLISIMYANNETGAIQPIKEIGKLISKINKNKEHRIYFHTDAVQATNWLDLNVDLLKVDLLTLSGHKIYGAKGVGVLYVRKGTPVNSLIHGGDQENGIRAGTENVPAIIGLGVAIEEVNKHRTPDFKRIERLRNKLIEGVIYRIPDSKFNGPLKERIPNIANFSFEGVEGESLVIALDQEGIAVSTGSACTSRELKPSHVLTTMGLSSEEAHSSLRVSLGRYTTVREIDYFLKVLPGIVGRLRKISGR